MEDIGYTFLTIFGVLVFIGIWVWFLYIIFNFFAKNYEKKPLKYVSVKKVESNKIKNNNTMENNQSIPTKYNKLSITGFVLSIISIFGIGLSGLVGFILGIIALVQIKHTKEKGKGLAIAAIIIVFIWSFVTSILKRFIEAGY